MKAVMLSIRPEWCEKIANGRKTIELRKSKPKLELPFKCYIYCTSPPSSELFTHGSIREYANELLRLQSGEIVYSYGMRLCCDPEGRPYTKDNFLCRKVIGEFVCDAILSHCEMANADLAEQMSCVRREKILEYSGGKEVFGWHISKLAIYDTPRPLYDFFVKCNEICEDCDWWEYVKVNADEFDMDCTSPLYGYKPLKRPPQSWCYVEET